MQAAVHDSVISVRTKRNTYGVHPPQLFSPSPSPQRPPRCSIHCFDYAAGLLVASLLQYISSLKSSRTIIRLPSVRPSPNDLHIRCGAIRYAPHS